jgi:hypothetical protein
VARGRDQTSTARRPARSIRASTRGRVDGLHGLRITIQLNRPDHIERRLFRCARADGLSSRLRLGGVGNTSAWRRDLSVIVGPIAFVWLADAGSVLSKALGSADRGYRPLKVLVVVKQGRQETVSVQRLERSKASLLYDPPTFPGTGRYSFDQGSPAVRFSACSGRVKSWSAATQFNGGFIVRGPLCLHLIVQDVSGSTRSFEVPIARGSSC